jgi:hypothetical protein
MKTSLWRTWNRKLPSWVGWLVFLLLFGPLIFSFTFTLLKSQTFSRRKLAKPNPTTYVFNAPIAQVRAAIREAGGTYPCPPSPTLCLSLYRPPNGTEYDLDQLEWTKSDVYHWLWKPLEYKAEYDVFVSPLADSQTRVEVRTVQAQVYIGSSFGAHGGALCEWVAPTTIEEYRILLMLGDKVAEQGMPPLQLPK